jgi:hypothetical protein
MNAKLFLLCATLAAWGLLPLASGLTVRKPAEGPLDVTARFSALDTELHSCLAGKRIVFIGPSTSKSDYLALAFFAEYGRWPDQDTVWFGQSGAYSGSGPNPLYSPNLEYGMKMEGLEMPLPSGLCRVGSSAPFLWYSNQIFNGHEICDCYKTGVWEGPKDVNNQTENRIYRNGDTMIAYFQWFGDVVPPRGTFSFSPLQQEPPALPSQMCPVGQFKGTWDWHMPLQTFISDAVSHFQPTHLIVDAAYWPIDSKDTTFWEGVSTAGVSAVLSSHGKVLWRTAPKRSDIRITEHSGDVDKSIFTNKGWQMYDAYDSVRHFQGEQDDDAVFFDNTHLKPQAQCHLIKDFLKTHVCSA